MKRLQRPAESKPGKVFQTGSSPTDSKVIDISFSYRSLGGVGSTIQSFNGECRMVAEADTPSEVQAMCTLWICLGA